MHGSGGGHVPSRLHAHQGSLGSMHGSGSGHGGSFGPPHDGGGGQLGSIGLVVHGSGHGGSFGMGADLRDDAKKVLARNFPDDRLARDNQHRARPWWRFWN